MGNSLSFIVLKGFKRMCFGFFCFFKILKYIEWFITVRNILFLFPIQANHSIKFASTKLRMPNFKFCVSLINFLYVEVLLGSSMH